MKYFLVCNHVQLKPAERNDIKLKPRNIKISGCKYKT